MSGATSDLIENVSFYTIDECEGFKAYEEEPQQ